MKSDVNVWVGVWVHDTSTDFQLQQSQERSVQAFTATAGAFISRSRAPEARLGSFVTALASREGFATWA